MKRFGLFHSPIKALALPVVLAASIHHATAERILDESFETPVVLEGATDPDGWTTSGHPSYVRAANESGQNWSTPYGEQGMSTYGNGVGTKDLGFMPDGSDDSGEYILRFKISSSAAIGEYRAELVTEPEIFGTPGDTTIVASAVGDTNGSKDMSYSGEIRWIYDPEDYPFPTRLKIKLMQDPDRSNWRHTPIWDNVTVDWIPDVDSAGPVVVDIVDDNQGGTVVATDSLVTYTVTFNEAMDASTVNPSDFGNAGGADVIIESVTPTSDDAVFLVSVRPTSEGSLRLEILDGADLKDAVGNAMDTTSDAIQDNVTFTVESGTPILLPTDIVDDKGGSSVKPDTEVTYTLTFSKDMDASSVSDLDFGNAGTALVTIGTITETTPGVFTVQVTPTGPGTLQFQVNPGVLITAADGGVLNTSSEIADDTTIVVDATPPTLASVDITDDTGGIPVAAGTLVTYDVFFSEDMDASTVDASDFGNAVTVGGAPFTIHAIEEASPGVFRIELTPTGAGAIQFQVNAGAVLTDQPGNALVTTTAIVDDSIVTVEAGDPYAAWSGGLAFDGDDNADGVTDGMAWLLGAATPSANAANLLPVASQSSGNLVLHFTCLKVANRGGAVLQLQYSKDLGAADLWWPLEVPDSSGTVNGVAFDISANADPNLVDVQATVPASAAVPGTTLFARLAGALP